MIQKKKLSVLTSLCCFTLASSLVHALPKEVTIVQGNVGVSTEENKMVITASDKAILNYSSFNIGAQETVQFVQPSTSSVVLNRVTGKDPSSILGNMTSNGRVFLVNPNGVYFGPDSKVDVGALVVSTMDIADQDFSAGHYQFNINGSLGKISHYGTIQAAEGGFLAFVSPFIDNQGAITAPKGSIDFVSGEKVVVDFTGDGLVSFVVDGALAKASIQQGGKLAASTVKMTVSSVEEVVNRVVNLSGFEEGTQMVAYNGEIQITNDSVIIAKAVDVSAKAGSEVSVDGHIELGNEANPRESGSLKVEGDSLNLSHFDVVSTGGDGDISFTSVGDAGNIVVADGGYISTPMGYSVRFATLSGLPIYLSNGAEVSSSGPILAFNSPVVLNGDHVAIHTHAFGNRILFNRKVVGSEAASDFLVDAGRGSIQFRESVGEAVSVGTVDLKASSLVLPEKIVTRGRDMMIAAATQFNQDTTLDTTGLGKYEGGNVVFNGQRSSIDGNFRFLVEAGKGSTRFDGAVGSRSTIQRFHLRSGHAIVKNHMTASGGTIIFDTPLLTVGDLVLTDYGPNGISFLNTVNAAGSACTDTLTLNAPMSRVLFAETVGGLTGYAGILINSNTYQQMGDLYTNNLTVNAPAGSIIAQGNTTNPCDSTPGTVDFQTPITVNGNVTISWPAGGTVDINGVQGVGSLSICASGTEVNFSGPIKDLSSLQVIARSGATVTFAEGAEVDILGDLVLGGDSNVVFNNRVIDTQGGAVIWSPPLLTLTANSLRTINTRGGPFVFDFASAASLGEPSYGTNVNTWGGPVRMNSGGTVGVPAASETSFVGVVNTGGGDFYMGGGTVTIGRSANGGAINTFGGDITVAGTVTNYATLNTGGGSFHSIYGSFAAAHVTGGSAGYDYSTQCGSSVGVLGLPVNPSLDRQVLITDGGLASYEQPVTLDTGLYVDVGVGGVAEFKNTVDGPSQLVVVGEEGAQAIFRGDVGAVTAPEALLVDVQGSVLFDTGVGATVNGPISLQGNSVGLGASASSGVGGVFNDVITEYAYYNGISIGGSLFLAGTATFSTTAGNPINFMGTVDSDSFGNHYGLVVDAEGSGVVTFNADVGTWSKLGQTSVTGGETRINGAHITVSSQDWSTPILLIGDSYLKSTSGSIRTGNTVNGDYLLNVDAATDVDIAGTVGEELPLTLFNTKAGANTILRAGITSYP